MTTVIKNQPPSAQIRAQLADAGKTVLVAFSLGKDAIATQLALAEAGVKTELVYLYYIPGAGKHYTLHFIEDTIKQLETQLDKKIHLYLHPSFWGWINHAVFQPPERLAIIEAANMPTPTYSDMWDLIRDDLGLPRDTLVADGVRAADSIVRRASLSRHGILKPAKRKVSPIADWLKAEVLGKITEHGIELPIDYKIFGRSFDGIDYRFLKPVHDNFPDDYRQILNWFPLADLELYRKEIA